MKTQLVLCALMTGVFAHSAQAQSDPRKNCPQEPCRVLYELDDNYQVQYKSIEYDNIAYPEDVLLVPKDGKIEGMPPKAAVGPTHWQFDKEAISRVSTKLKALRKGAVMSAPSKEEEADGPAVHHGWVPDKATGHAGRLTATCADAHKKLLDAAMTNILMRPGKNNPFMGAGISFAQLDTMCGDQAEQVTNDIKTRVREMQSLHSG